VILITVFRQILSDHLQIFAELNGKFKLSFYRITEDRRGGDSFDQPPHEADVAEAIDSDLNGISGEMRAFRQA